MDIERFRELCLTRPGVTETFPFNEQTLVFKVMNKVFALTDIDTFESVNLKCDPERAVQLREQFMGIKPGYHMNKRHWNTLLMDGTIPDKIVEELIGHSYNRVVSGLTKKDRSALERIPFGVSKVKHH